MSTSSCNQRSRISKCLILPKPRLFTKLFAAEFGDALSLADIVIVTEVYGAREKPVSGVDAALVAGYVGVEVSTAANLEDLRAQAVDTLRAGDTCFTIGAGDITTVGPQLLADLAERDTR